MAAKIGFALVVPGGPQAPALRFDFAPERMGFWRIPDCLLQFLGPSLLLAGPREKGFQCTLQKKGKRKK